MSHSKRLCLIVNAASGSNDEAAVSEVQAAFTQNGFTVEKLVCFPDDELPSPQTLENLDLGLVAIFTGDGTINHAIQELSGWRGRLLVLPGGTMNLLARRLHGDAGQIEIIECLARDGARTIRPRIARCESGIALAGLLAGPGTGWSEVREAMRTIEIGKIVAEAVQAIDKTVNGPRVGLSTTACLEPEYFPLVELTPSEWGIVANGYHAEQASDFAAQSWALVRRRFREGPHRRIGLFDELALQSETGGQVDILLDGEPARISARSPIWLDDCPVDLLAIGPDG